MMKFTGVSERLPFLALLNKYCHALIFLQCWRCSNIEKKYSEKKRKEERERERERERGREREKRMKRKSYFPSSLWPVYVKFAASL